MDTDIIGTYRLLQESLRFWRSLIGERQAGFRLLHAEKRLRLIRALNERAWPCRGRQVHAEGAESWAYPG
jgi:hypothetical protein